MNGPKVMSNQSEEKDDHSALPFSRVVQQQGPVASLYRDGRDTQYYACRAGLMGLQPIIAVVTRDTRLKALKAR